jgi:hypothetical protein
VSHDAVVEVFLQELLLGLSQSSLLPFFVALLQLVEFLLKLILLFGLQLLKFLLERGQSLLKLLLRLVLYL